MRAIELLGTRVAPVLHKELELETRAAT